MQYKRGNTYKIRTKYAHTGAHMLHTRNITNSLIDFPITQFAITIELLQADKVTSTVVIIDGESDDENENTQNLLPETVDQESAWTELGKQKKSFVKDQREESDDEYVGASLDQEWLEVGKQQVSFVHKLASTDDEYNNDLRVDDDWNKVGKQGKMCVQRYLSPRTHLAYILLYLWICFALKHFSKLV